LREPLEFDRLLAGSVSEAWVRCLPMWRERGRIEDLPRNVHVGSYRVSPEKWLGRAFGWAFLADWPFVAGKLSSPDPFEAACAHDALKYMMERWEVVPVGVWAISAPILTWVRQEMADCPNRYAAFSGRTLGELFRYESEQGL
jgi:hypothetical protein